MGLWDGIVRRGTTGEYRKEVKTIDQLVSVIHVDTGYHYNTGETLIGIATRRCRANVKVVYPLMLNKTSVECESTIRWKDGNNIRIRKATADEIRCWKRASGYGASKRCTLKTEDDVLKLSEVLDGDEIITGEKEYEYLG